MPSAGNGHHVTVKFSIRIRIVQPFAISPMGIQIARKTDVPSGGNA